LTVATAPAPEPTAKRFAGIEGIGGVVSAAAVAKTIGSSDLTATALGTLRSSKA
jgi:hypothetical protein